MCDSCFQKNVGKIDFRGRWDDDGSVSDHIKTDEVWAVEWEATPPEEVVQAVIRIVEAHPAACGLEMEFQEGGSTKKVLPLQLARERRSASSDVLDRSFALSLSARSPKCSFPSHVIAAVPSSNCPSPSA